MALVSDEGCFENTRWAPRLHNHHVLAMIDDVLGAASVAKSDIDVIAFGAGPGSFTGVRIGASVAQGIAFAVGARVVRVPSSAVAAETARRVSARRGVFRVCRESRPGWRYAARYELSDGGALCLDFDKLEATPHMETLGDDIIDGARFAVSARMVAQLAMQSVDAAVAPALAQPFYVEGDSPWRPAGDPSAGIAAEAVGGERLRKQNMRSPSVTGS